jgi:hypothetical protein
MPAQDVIQQKLEAARRELLDLTGRNRLLNAQRSSSRSSRLEIVDEKTQEVFRRLVVEGKAMSFLPGIDPDEEPDLLETRRESEAPAEPQASPTVPSPLGGEGAQRADEREGTSNVQHSTFNIENSELEAGRVPPTLALGQPDEDEPGEEEAEGPAERHIDDNLQTPLTTEKLQRRLLNLFYDARTYQEEQGVNILFLALGFLKWYEPDRPDRPRYAPLILVPVVLARRSAGTKFRIRYADEEIITNLSLGEKLKVDFKVELPEIPEGEDLDPSAYFDAVRTAVATEERWQVLSDDIVLWFFSFSKFLMYRDLQSENWPAARPIDQHPLVESLLTTGFASQPPLCGEEAHIDALLDPRDTIHVTDADSSQAIAIEEVRRGRNLVIQGPPGTGKSQTITNLIAASPDAVQNRIREVAGQFALSVAQVRAVWSLIGNRFGVVFSEKVPDEGRRSLTGTDIPLEFVRWSIRHEDARTLDDLVERRLMLTFTAGLSRETLEELAGEMIDAGLLAVSEVEAAIDEATIRLRHYYGMCPK